MVILFYTHTHTYTLANAFCNSSSLSPLFSPFSLSLYLSEEKRRKEPSSLFPIHLDMRFTKWMVSFNQGGYLTIDLIGTRGRRFLSSRPRCRYLCFIDFALTNLGLNMSFHILFFHFTFYPLHKTAHTFCIMYCALYQLKTGRATHKASAHLYKLNTLGSVNFPEILNLAFSPCHFFSLLHGPPSLLRFEISHLT